MRTTIAIVAVAVAGSHILAPSDAHGAAAVGVFETRPCPTFEVVAVGVRCGVVRAPENYSAPDGRQIELSVLVLPATGSTHELSAQYDMDGGPGLGATDFLNFYAAEGAPYRRSRDIVLADMRGAGHSNPLRCSGIEVLERSNALAPMYPPELVAECAKQLAPKADATAYSTAAAARDIDVIRQALGYEQLDLNALSYGTTLALRYIAEFPERVRSAVLVGTVPADRTPPRYHAAVGDRALQMVFEDCARNAACSTTFGDVASDLDRALRRLSSPDAVMGRDVFMEKLRSTMYTSGGLRQVPFLLHRAAAGDFSAFAKADPGLAGRSFANGLYLSITCAETLARIDVESAIASAAKTSFGAYRLTRQAAACKQWPVGNADAKLTAKGSFDTPVLFIAGDMDAVSPPQWAAETLAMFPNGRYTVVPNGGHVFDGMTGLETCFDRVVIDFFDRGTATGLDLSCLSEMKPPPYRTNAVQ